MTLLGTRFPRLSMVPHVPLVRATPVETLALPGGPLYAKRDDRSASAYGGNKVRKLEFLLGDARRRGASVLLTAGAWGSHHVLATAIYGSRWGYAVHAVVAPQRRTLHVDENLRAGLGLGARFHPVRRGPLVPAELLRVQAALRARGEKPYRIPFGGSSPTGALGYVEAGLELAGQIQAREVPESDVLVVALGSGGTLAGLAVGFAAAGLTVPLVGVRVTPRAVAHRRRVVQLAQRVIARLRAMDASFPAVEAAVRRSVAVDSRFFAPGYGEPSVVAEEAQARAAELGLVVDTTYTARAFAAALRRHGEGQRVLYWHTLSGADLTPLLGAAPEVPAWAGGPVRA
ncbi:MAG: pyridoxal-phosphate dependent enzyme [Myxococcota bacterium]